MPFFFLFTNVFLHTSQKWDLTVYTDMHSPFYLAICHEQLFGSQNTRPQHPLRLRLQTERRAHRRPSQCPVTGLSILVTCAVFESLRRDLQIARQVSKQQGHCTPHRSQRQGPWIGLRCEAAPGSVLLSPGWVPLGSGK